jgi:hypothetical protein
MLGFLTCMLCSCDQHVVTQTKVSEDGSLERTVTLLEVDSAAMKQNAFGLQDGNGWKMTVSPSVKHADKANTNEEKFIISFSKKFPRVEDANAEFQGLDSVFHIKSSFEKKFRWFYTYISYSDTYEAVERFKNYPASEYFVKEELDFIQRLPQEGKSVSRADSVFLRDLTDKVYERYAGRAMFEDHYVAFVSAAQKNNLSRQWLDTLALAKEEMLQLLLVSNDLPEELFLPVLIRKVSPDFPMGKIAEDYATLYKPYGQNFKMMTEMGTYDAIMHMIEIPGEITAHNADSVSGNVLFWKPMILKFMLDDHVMHVETRKTNYWAFVVSGVIIVLTVALFLRRPR